MRVETKNTPESCWRSNQVCWGAEYVKHILLGKVILTYSVPRVHWHNKQKNVVEIGGMLK